MPAGKVAGEIKELPTEDAPDEHRVLGKIKAILRMTVRIMRTMRLF